MYSVSILILGVHGYFEVTQDITKYCKAKLFSEVGKKTPVFVRFSTVGMYCLCIFQILYVTDGKFFDI